MYSKWQKQNMQWSWQFSAKVQILLKGWKKLSETKVLWLKLENTETTKTELYLKQNQNKIQGGIKELTLPNPFCRDSNICKHLLTCISSSTV